MTLWVSTETVELCENFSEGDFQAVVRAVYRQVLGNAHLADSERLDRLESLLHDGRLTVRGFVLAVGQSDLYRKKFFESNSQYRFIELNFKHFLGRAPLNQTEISEHVQRYHDEGYDAEISSYVDSLEYAQSFGERFVPYARAVNTQSGLGNVTFNRSLSLMRGDATSDASSSSNLIDSLASGSSPSIVLPAGQAPRVVLFPTPDPTYGVKPLPARPFVASVAASSYAALPAVQPSAGERFLQSLDKPSSESLQIPQPIQNTSPASALQGVTRFQRRDPVELLQGRSNEEAEVVIKAVYKQVLGNAYVMESERLTVPESQLKRGEISVREFVRQVAKSELYRSRFFDACPRYRYIELAFRHILGRTPIDLEEMRGHSTTLDTQGFGADIDSFVDSAEYQDRFGEDTVPYLCGYETETCQSMVQFTHFFEMVRGDSSSSLKGSIAGKAPVLNGRVINTQATPLKSTSGAGAVFSEPALGSRQRHGVGASADGKMYRVEVTAYRSKAVSRVSRFRRSNKVYMVPFDQLSETYKRIHRQGGVIASIAPVS